MTLPGLRGSGDSPFVGVVDADEALCSSLVDLMRSIGYCAESFTSAQTLLDFDNLSSVDCVIADVHMPEMGGIDLIRKLQERGIATPVILITLCRRSNWMRSQVLSGRSAC